jgi:hypothetical protein
MINGDDDDDGDGDGDDDDDLMLLAVGNSSLLPPEPR